MLLTPAAAPAMVEPNAARGPPDDATPPAAFAWNPLALARVPRLPVPAAAALHGLLVTDPRLLRALLGRTPAAAASSTGIAGCCCCCTTRGCSTSGGCSIKTPNGPSCSCMWAAPSTASVVAFLPSFHICSTLLLGALKPHDSGSGMLLGSASKPPASSCKDLSPVGLNPRFERQSSSPAHRKGEVGPPAGLLQLLPLPGRYTDRSPAARAGRRITHCRIRLSKQQLQQSWQSTTCQLAQRAAAAAYLHLHKTVG